MALLISIHDVTPALAEPVRRLWELCLARGAVPALLVVPNWHGEWPLERHAEFVAWVRACAGRGAEIVLHGERHDEVGSPRGWRDEVRAWGRTNREGEFLTLDAPAATARIARGLATMRSVGLEPTGFIPPAWLSRAEARTAAAQAGLAFTEDDGAVYLLPADRRIASPVVRWSGRTAVRAWGSVVVGEARWRLQRRAPVARIALHPADLAHPATARAVERALDRWLAVRRPTSYAALA